MSNNSKMVQHRAIDLPWLVREHGTMYLHVCIRLDLQQHLNDTWTPFSVNERTSASFYFITFNYFLSHCWSCFM